MTCPSVLQCALYVDAALTPQEAGVVARHLDDCPACRARVALLETESRFLRETLRRSEIPVPIPAFNAPARGPAPARALLWLGWLSLAFWSVSVVWSELTGLEIPNWLSWLAPSALGAGIEMAIAALLGVLNGGVLLDSGILPIGSVLLMTVAVGAILGLIGHRSRRAAHLCLVGGVAVLLATGAPAGHAFDVRRDEVRITVGADETIDDTLVVMSESVLIEGTVTGDLVAMGERVTIRGRVDGLVVAMAETLIVDGDVGGTLLVMGESVDLRGAALASNAYAMGRKVSFDDQTRIAGNAAVAAESAQVQGTVGRDLLALADRFALLGRVDGNLRSASGKLDVADSARIGGDLTARLESADNADIDAAAVIGGATAIESWERKPNRYLNPGYYAGQVLKFVAAFVTGLILLRFCPGLREVPLTTGGELLTAGGLGALVLIAVPALALAAVLTLIGAPLGIGVMLLWVIALYLAGIVVAAIAGARLLPGEARRPATTLLIGLLVVFVMISLPFIGGLIRLAVIVLGLGVMVLYGRTLWRLRGAAAV